jgi:hypothetical protein
MKNTFAIIRNFLFGSFALLLISTSAFAAPLVRTAAGANTTDLSVAMAFFRKDLGGKINATGNSYTSGRREIDWEDYQQVIGTARIINFPTNTTTKSCRRAQFLTPLTKLLRKP